MSGEASYLSRFFLKFVEIIAAGLATAVSAYLIAPLGGHLPALIPTTLQGGATPGEVSMNLRPEPVPPVAATANEQRPAPQQDADAPAAQTVRKAAKVAKPTLPRKHSKTATSMAESKLRADEPIEVVVRAALVNSDANRSARPDVAPHQADVPPRPAVVEAEPRPANISPGSAATGTTPRTADVQPQLMQPHAVQSGPATAVDVKSRPTAVGEALPPIPPASIEIGAPPPVRSAEKDEGVFSLNRIPDWLRPDPAHTGEAPRPPMPVGQFGQELM